MDPLWHKMRKFWNSSFACTVQWCMTICHKPFSISWGPFENVFTIFCIENADLKPHEKYQCKSFISQFRIKSCGMDPPDPTWESFEILLLHVLSNDAWQFAINLFSISWGPFENVHLLFFVLKMQIWNPMKNINVYLSFLSLGSKLWNEPPWPNMKIFEILLLHVLSSYVCKFAINLFSTIWGPLENVNLPFFSIQNAD